MALATVIVCGNVVVDVPLFAEEVIDEPSSFVMVVVDGEDEDEADRVIDVALLVAIVAIG